MRRQRHHPIAEIDRLLQIVGNEESGDARLRDEREQFVLQFLPRHGVERAERLVHQQHGWVLRKAARDLQPLLHSARHLRGKVAGVLFEPDLGEQFGDARRTLAARSARGFEGERDIALRSAPRQQRIGVVLENDGDVARWRALGAAAVGHGAGRRLQQAGDQP